MARGKSKTFQFVFAGDATDLKKAIGDAAGSTGSLGDKALKFGKVAAAGLAVAGAAAVGAGVAFFKMGAEFDRGFDAIRIGTGATGEALDALKESAKNVFADTPASFDQVSAAIADLNTRLGLTGEPLEALAQQFLNLSRITGSDVAGNIESATRVFGDWGIVVEDQAAALDQMFRASQSTGIGIDQLGRTVVQFGAPLRQMGFDFEESIGIIGKFEKEGVNAELVLGSMRVALSRLAKAGESAPEAFQRMTQSIAEMEDPTAATAAAMELFGTRAGPDMAAAIREGRFELGDLYDTIKNGSDTINQAAADTEDFSEKFERLKNNVLVALEPIATRVFEAIGDFAAWATPYIVEFIEWLGPKMEAALAGLQAWWETNGPKIQQFLTDVHTAATEFGEGFKAAWETMVKPAWTELKKAFLELRTAVSEAMSKITGDTEGFGVTWRQVGTAVAFLIAVQIRILSTLVKSWEVLFTVLDKIGVFDMIGGAIEGVTTIINAFKRALDEAKKAFEGLKTLIAGGLPALKAPNLNFSRFDPRNWGSSHSGGVIPGVPGTEQLRLVQAGEVVQSREMARANARTSGGGALVVNFNNSVVASERQLVEMIERARRQGVRASWLS